MFSMRQLAVLLILFAAPLFAAKNLEVFFVDVEGGQATLIVTPSGQSMLVDTGWRGFNFRDADRIAAAAKSAHVKQIDYVLITHYHRDHVGGVPQLLNRIKVGTFVDHGPNTETNDKSTREDYADYEKALSQAQHLVVKPGDTVPLKGVDVTIVAANGEHLTKALGGGGQANPFCDGVKPKGADPSENARSVGFVLKYGSFSMLDLGDLTWNKELDLVCPNDLLGHVDLYVVSHHGSDQSGSPALVKSLGARVAIMDNGARKGGSPEAWQTVKDAPGLEDIWQVHYSMEGGEAHNTRDSFIANVDEACQGKYLKLTAESDGSFTVWNQRNKFEKEYGKK